MLHYNSFPTIFLLQRILHRRKDNFIIEGVLCSFHLDFSQPFVAIFQGKPQNYVTLFLMDYCRCCATTLSQECITVSKEYCIHSSAFVEGKTPSINSKYYCVYLSMFAMAMDMFSKECPPFPQQFQFFRLQIFSFSVFGLPGKVYGKNNASRDVSLDWHIMTNLSGQTRSWKTQKLKPGGESDWVPFPQEYIHTSMHAYTQTDIQTYRYTDIQTYRHTHTQTYRHPSIHAYMHTRILAYMHTCIHACMHTCIHTDTSYIHACTHACMQTGRQTDRHTDIQTYRHTDIQTYRHTDIQTYWLVVSNIFYFP